MKKDHIGALANLPKLNEENIFIDAGVLSYRNKLLSKGVGLIDSSIVACALKNGYEILSLNKKLLGVIQNLN